MKDLFLTYVESQKILRVLINSLPSLIIANALDVTPFIGPSAMRVDGHAAAA